MRNYVDDIIKNTVGQIKYRESITLGEIKIDNGDGTYGVEISQSGKTYPNVPTAHYGDTFAVGEIAIITYEYGNKEMPRIWGHAKKIAQNPVEVEVDYSGSGGSPITTVTTLDAYSKTSNSAYLEGKIELSNGAGNCTRRGFKYGLTTAYGSDTHDDGDYEAGYFNKQITGLNADETYHYQAYVLDANSDEQAGEDKIMTTSGAGEIYVTFETGPGGSEVSTIKSFTVDGVAGISWQPEEYQLMYQGMCVDSSKNVYYIAFTTPYKIIKYNSSGVEVVSLAVSSTVQAIAIGNDGYIYTLEDTQTDNDVIVKRNPTTLAEISHVQLDPTHSYYGMAFLDDDRFYTVNGTDDVLEMFKASNGAEQGEVVIDSGKTTLTSLAVAGSTVLGVDFTVQPWYVPTNLGASEIDWSTEITRVVSVASKDGYFYVFGNKVNGEALYLGKYTEAGVKVWVIEVIGAGYYPSSVGAYPF